MQKEIFLMSQAIGVSVAELFQSQVINNPKALAIIDLDNKKYTYQELLLRVLKLSKFLINKGIKAKEAIEQDSNVNYILDTLGGKIVDSSITPKEST